MDRALREIDAREEIGRLMAENALPCPMRCADRKNRPEEQTP